MMDTALKQLFDGFLLAKEADGVRETTLETYRVMYRSLVNGLDPGPLQDAASISPQDLQRWVVGLGGYARATRDQRIAKCKSFFAWCQANGFLDANPAENLKRPKKNWQPDPLSSERLGFLLDTARQGRNGARNYAILCVLLDSGIRNTELCNLTVDDVSLKTGQIKVTEGKGAKVRTVIIGKRAKEALWRWMMQRPASSDYLFCTEQGRQLHRVRLRVIVANIGKRVGIHVYPHRLRHTFALQYLKLGGDPYSLQYLLGHEDMTTVREYVKIAAADVLDMYRSPLDALE
jgi:site-specific recombinase XerD